MLRTDWWALKLYVWLLHSVGCNHRCDRVCELFIGTVRSGLEKCLFEYLLYLQSLKEMHSTMDGSISDYYTHTHAHAHTHYGICLATLKYTKISSYKERCDKPNVDWSMSKLDKNNSTVTLNHNHDSVFVRGMELRKWYLPRNVCSFSEDSQTTLSDLIKMDIKLVCCTLHFLPSVC